MKRLIVTPIKTKTFKTEDLVEFIISSVPKELIQEKMILVITLLEN